MSEITTVTLGGRQVLVKREDLLHPYVSGNKFRKLKYNLLRALELGASEIISFGGAFSNHIHALAYACQFYSIPLRLFIRGEVVHNPTLDFVRSTGANLHFVSRDDYRVIKECTSFNEYPNAIVIPEGGSNKLAITGILEMMEELDQQLSDFFSNKEKIEGYNYCVSYGSGATSIGMMASLKESDQLHVFSALKMKSLIVDFESNCNALDVQSQSNVTLHDNYHFGGFAKYDSDLITFINSFELPLDPLYTGKLFFGINDLILKDEIDSRPIVAIHTGGLQGVAGFNLRFGGLIRD